MKINWGILILMISSGWDNAFAQAPLFDFGFSERWQSLKADVDAGRLKLTDSGLPIGLNTATQKLSDGELYLLSIRTREKSIPLNRIHNWIVRVETHDRMPVKGAELRFFGGMPMHNHGFPTHPVIMEELGNGDYLLGGVKFSMVGWWQMFFAIITEDKVDTVTFDLALEY